MRFQTEQSSIEFFKNQLIQSGFTSVDCTQVEDKYCYYDIQAEYHNKKCRFELKRRDMTSDKYGDSVLELYKYANFIEDIVNQKIYKGFVVSFFDDIYTIDDITNSHSIQLKQAPATTEFENTKKKDKWFVKYNQEKKFKYCHTD